MRAERDLKHLIKNLLITTPNSNKHYFNWKIYEMFCIKVIVCSYFLENGFRAKLLQKCIVELRCLYMVK